MMTHELKLARMLIAEIGHFASLQDVGKIAVPDRNYGKNACINLRLVTNRHAR